MNRTKALSMLLCAVLLTACGAPDDQASAPAAVAQSAETPQPAATVTNGRVFFVSPADGAKVSSPVTVAFGIEGFSVAPAGTYDPSTGHHHLLIDTGLPPLDQPIPADANHVHFGKGQTETTLALAPGNHTLQLLLGDGNHVPHQPPLASDIITITVSE